MTQVDILTSDLLLSVLYHSLGYKVFAFISINKVHICQNVYILQWKWHLEAQKVKLGSKVQIISLGTMKLHPFKNVGKMSLYY
jgi:hypothetical protein